MLLECKRCSRCKETKSLEEFQICATKGRQVYCKRCKSEYAKELYNKKKQLRIQAEQISHQRKYHWSTKDQAAAYLAGLIDGEGHIARYIDSSGIYRTRHIAISNTDKDIIRACMEACEVLGLTYSVKSYERYTKPGNKKPEFRLHIYGKINCEKVLTEVPIRCVYKFQRLQEVVNSFERSMDRRQADSYSALDAGEVMLPNANPT